MTPKERQILLDLIRLYEAMASNRHSRSCECEVCSAIEAVDESESSVFASLERKAKGYA